MIKVKNFDNWIEDKISVKFGSGASEKIWLINPETNEKGLFKFPKVKDKEKVIITGEYWAEKLATEIGKLIDVECARVDIGTYRGRIGSMSYNIITDSYSKLLEGIEFIQSRYPYYDKDKLKDVYSDEKYSIQMVQNSIIGLLDIDKFYKIVIFDILIGNSDRHHSNWGIMPKRRKDEINHITNVYFDICPLYDNGSSLCAYEDNNDIQVFF